MDISRQKTAIVLGGTVPHIDLIKELKKRAYHTVLIDYFTDPPAAVYADVHYRESAMDLEAVLAIAKKYDTKLVLSSCLDQQMNVAMKVAEELGLSHPFSFATAEKVTNKRMMKKIMMEYHIPTAKYYVVDRDFDLSLLDLKAPVIIKPDASSGSAGVTKLSELDQKKLKESLNKACSFGLTGKAIVEEFIDGCEMSVHAIADNGHARILFGTSRVCDADENTNLLLYNVYLPKLNAALQKKLEDVADQILAAFELKGSVPLFMQVMIKDEEVYVLEFSPRLGGGISSMVAKDYTGIDLISFSIDSYLGIRREYDETAVLGRYVCCLPIYAKKGIYEKLKGVDQLIDQNMLHAVIKLKEAGEEADDSKPSRSIVAKLVFDASSIEECYSKMRRFSDLIDVEDPEGNSIRLPVKSVSFEEFSAKLTMMLQVD
ncbi:MAG: ATP-grasp domain-containing protein [Erysipelotrichaceae bacterium]|nr:ATP-grasp domain-containing protein [Erysipelotrichaceae bacterium]